MEINIKFCSILKGKAGSPDGIIKRDIISGATVGEALKGLNLIEGEVGLIIVNSKIAYEDTILKDGDNVELYPIVAGG